MQNKSQRRRESRNGELSTRGEVSSIERQIAAINRKLNGGGRTPNSRKTHRPRSRTHREAHPQDAHGTLSTVQVGKQQRSFEHVNLKHLVDQSKVKSVAEKKKLNAVKHLLMQTTDPLTAYSIRMGGPPGSITGPTAVARIPFTIAGDWMAPGRVNVLPTDVHPQTPHVPSGTVTLGESVDTVPLMTSDTDFGMVLTRHPLVPAIVLYANPEVNASMSSNSATAIYGLVFEGLEDFIAPVVTGQTTVFPLSHCIHSSGPDLYGDTFPAFMRNNGDPPFLWVDSDNDGTEGTGFSHAQFVYTATQGGPAPYQAGTFEVSAHLLTTTGWAPVTAVRNGSIPTEPYVGTVEVPLPCSGYYHFSVTFLGATALGENVTFLSSPHTVFGSGGAVANLQIGMDNNPMQQVFRHTFMQGAHGLDQSSLIATARTNGVCALLQNMSPELTKGGTVYAVQQPGDVYWPTSIHDLQSVTDVNLSLRYIGPWEKGYFGYVKPQSGSNGNTPMQLRAVHVASAFTRLSNALIFDPFDLGGYVSVRVTPPMANVATPNYSSSLFNLSICQAIEFTTLSPLITSQPSFITQQMLDYYTDSLKGLPQHFCNKFHWMDLARFIASSASHALQVAENIVVFNPAGIASGITGAISDTAGYISKLKSDE